MESLRETDTTFRTETPKATARAVPPLYSTEECYYNAHQRTLPGWQGGSQQCLG